MSLGGQIKQIAGQVARDTISLWPLVLTAVLSAALLNSLRPNPLPWLRLSDDLQLAARVSEGPFPEIPEPGTVSLDEAVAIFKNGEARFVDAREVDFYLFGHIPKARSLPREGFEEVFPLVAGELGKESALVVYCSEAECPDSLIVAKALMRLGYRQVRVFVGGWQEWTTAELPQEP